MSAFPVLPAALTVKSAGNFLGTLFQPSGEGAKNEQVSLMLLMFFTGFERYKILKSPLKSKSTTAHRNQASH
uniref:Uncharacterized protein n=2 Tax=Anguilla anguilla TaxID=7936 RepID=A0A0E9PV61_ANGAN